MSSEIHVYAGTAGHSAWFSEDAGETWVHPNSHSGLYLEARVWCFADHPESQETLYAGSDHGLFRWDEVSARWTLLSSPMTDVWALAVDPRDPHVLLAGTRPAALYRSEDGGSSWQLTQTDRLSDFSDVNMGPTRVTQILFDPFHADTIWATVEIGGILRSRDRGRTWTLCEQGLVSSDVHGIAVTRHEGVVSVLAATNRGLHRSMDCGDSWVFEAIPSPWQYVRSVAIACDDPATVFLTNGNGPPGNDGRLLRSHDGGRNWQTLPLPGVINSTVWCVVQHPSDAKLIFCCTNLGQLFRSTDGGDNWSRLPHEFGELRSLHWRPQPIGIRQQPHAITRAVVKAPIPVE